MQHDAGLTQESPYDDMGPKLEVASNQRYLEP